MHICVVTEGYPGLNDSAFVFVQQLCHALADNGVTVSVIAPQSITKAIVRRRNLDPVESIILTNNKNKVKVYRPYILTIGGVKGFLKMIVDKITSYVISRVVNRMGEMPDICYGHFWHTAYILYPAAKKYGLPLFVSTGESQIQLHKQYSEERLKEFVEYVSGVVCVSNEKKEDSINNGLLKKGNCIVLPNGIDCDKFYLKDKIKMRERLGLSLDDFVVVSVGGFDHRKGTKRIADAIKLLSDKHVKSIFIGSSTQKKFEPDCGGIVYKGRLMHNEIVDYLNCADVFVLPTLKEGSCNAILEAMACGLPIISSDLGFNYDILNETYALFVDPLSIKEISVAIKYLKDNPEKRRRMGEAAYKASKKYDIDKRAKTIINYIDACVMRN